MKNSIDDLRDHLFETLEALKDPDNPMDIKRAKTVSEVAQTVINTAKVELDFVELTGLEASGFLDATKRPALPKPNPKPGQIATLVPKD